MRRSVFIFVALCLLGVSARADQVVLEKWGSDYGNDRQIGRESGRQNEDGFDYQDRFCRRHSGAVGFRGIGCFRRNHCTLQLKDGQTIVGPVTTSNDKFDVATATTGEVATSEGCHGRGPQRRRAKDLRRDGRPACSIRT